MTHESDRVSRYRTDGHSTHRRWVPALAGLALVVISMVLVTPALAAVGTTPGKGTANGNGPPPGKGPPPGVNPPGLSRLEGRVDRDVPGSSGGGGETPDGVGVAADPEAPAPAPVPELPATGRATVAKVTTVAPVVSPVVSPVVGDVAAGPRGVGPEVSAVDEANPSAADAGATAVAEPDPSRVGFFPMPFSAEPPGVGAWLVAVIMGGVAFGYALRYVTSRAQVAAVRRYATRDPLTGLPNRGLFDETLTREVARQRRKATSLGLVLIDLDGFKRLNDTRGHGCGDDALRAVAETIVGRVRESDLPSRIGGDEFAVVLPDCLADDAMRVGEALRQRIELAVGPLVTASVGVAVMPDHATDADGLVAAADAALYVAKGRGGNEAYMGPVHAVARAVDE